MNNGRNVQYQAESDLEKELRKFKGIASARQIASCATLSGTYLADHLLFNPEFISELIDVDAALVCLQTRISDCRMPPILSKLFERTSTLKAIRAWDQSLSEIFVFAHFESLGILHSIGWPSDFPTDAPFDFAINIQGNIVAGDVKPANGSGYRLLEQTLRRCVSEQAEQLSIAVPRVTIRYHGPLTQEIVGAALESSLISDFKLRIVDLSLLEPQTFALPIGSTIVNVILGETEELGGGITGTSLLSDALAVTFKNHIEIKGSHGSKYDVPFLVAYVRLPGRGSSDLKTYASFGDTVAKAITLLGSPTSSWLGNLLLCPGTRGSKPRFYESSNAIWPVGISANTLSHGLGAMLTPVPRFLEDIHG